MRLANLITTALLASAIGAALVAASRPVADADVPRAPQTTTVRTAAVTSAPERTERIYYGLVAGAEQAVAAFALPGRLVQRPVDTGDRVEAGDIVAVLDDEGPRNAVRAASAQLDELRAQRDQLERDLDRARALNDARVGNLASIEQIEAGLTRTDAAMDAAAASLAEARRALRETVLEAPCAGVVTDTFAEVGEVVGAGMPVVRIDAGGGLEVRLDVPESAFAHIDVGASVEVRFPLSDLAPTTGVVRSVSSAGSAIGRLFPVSVVIDEGAAAAAGMSAEVVLEMPAPQGLAVPTGSIVDPTGDAPSVYRVTDQTIERVAVELVALTRDAAIVRGPLREGDAVVTAGVHRVAEGMRIEVAP